MNITHEKTMKQTAVEWFFKALIENQDKTYKQIELILEQAKEMEKEQIIEAITKTIIGSNVIYDNEYPEVIYTAEQYYNETYESNT